MTDKWFLMAGSNMENVYKLRGKRDQSCRRALFAFGCPKNRDF